VCFTSDQLRLVFLLQYVVLEPFMGTSNLQSNGPLYSNTVIGTQTGDGCIVIFGTAVRGLGGTAARLVPPVLYQM